jgi:glycosyltransferase involved in cell wall biosynthesis
MSLPLVSIVIPNFNYARFLGAAIRSALAQTWSHLEVIVVDDGSTDGSAEIIRRFGRRVQAIFRENSGQTAANNAGFAAARGDFVLFLDADDALRPDAVERAVAAFRPGVSAVQFCLATIDQEGGKLGGVYPPLPRDWTPSRIRQTLLRSGFYPFPPTSGNAYARWFLEEVFPIDPALLPKGTDGALNAVAPLYGDVVVLRDALGFYRLHGANMGALDVLDTERFAFYVDLDRRRAAFLERHAEKLGVALPKHFLDRAFFHLQYRLASLKLRPERHPYGRERLRRVLALLARSAVAAPEPTLTRALVLAWGTAVAISPRPLAQALVAARFISSQRPALLDSALRRLGLVRRERTPEVARAGHS